MSKIVIPVDFSADSKNTVRYGIMLADHLDKDILLLHSIHIDFPSYGQMGNVGVQYQPQDIEVRKENAEREFDRLLDEVYQMNKANVNIEKITKTGFFADTVITLSSRKDTYMILLTGRSRDRSESGFVTDSNSVIIEGAECPVIVVPPTASFEKINRILYATDFQKEDVDSLKKLSEFAGVFDAQIIALHISDNPDFSNRIQEEGFNKMIAEKVGYPLITVTTMPADKIATGVENYAHNLDVNLIAILKENDNFWKRLFGKSHTKKLILKTDKPVIVFHQKK